MVLPKLRPPRTNMRATQYSPLPGRDCDHVGIVIDVGGDDLLRLNRPELRQLIARARSLLEVQLLGGGFHAPGKFELHFVIAPLQHLDRRVDVARVALRRDQSDAGRRAALDLILQAGSGAVIEIGVIAIAHAEQPLQLLQGLAYRAGRRIRPEEAPGLLARSAIKVEPRKIVLRLQMQVGKTLVIAQHDVEARTVLLDEVELEQQRLGIGIGDGDFHVRGLRDQRLHLRLDVARLKVGSDAALEIARLADVENVALGVEHAIHAGTARQRIDERLRIEGVAQARPTAAQFAWQPIASDGAALDC